MPPSAAAEVLVFAKEPRPGQVKTRLCPPLSAEQAARCHRAFTRDTLARLSALNGVRIVLAATPDDASPWLAALAAQAGVELVPQGAGDLGVRMERALRRAEERSAVAIIVGTDSPDLPMAYVHQALAALEQPGVVLGPAHDGGYYLLGCRGPVPPVFSLSAPWGSSAVLAETVERLDAWRGRYRLLPPWWDVDDIGGLAALAARCRVAVAGGGVGERDAAACPATRAVLRALGPESTEP